MTHIIFPSKTYDSTWDTVKTMDALRTKLKIL